MREIVFGIYAEGNTDYRYFEVLLERYSTQYCVEQGIDAGISLITIRNKGDYPTTFLEKMLTIETEYAGLHYIFVHNDADARSSDAVLEHKWEPWMNQCKDTTCWVAVVPIRMTESWMLADTEAIKSTFIVKSENIRGVLEDRDVESIPNPKDVLREIARQGKQNKLFNYEALIAKRTNFVELERLSSFRFLQAQIQEKIVR